MSESKRDTVELLGLRFDRLTRAQAADAVVELARSAGKHYVVKPYSEFIPRARRDASVRETLTGASLCLADGVGIIWASRFLGRPLPQAMRGIDFTWEMLAALDRAGLSVYLLGGTADEVRLTQERIRERLPGLSIAGTHQGHLARGESETVISEINAASPDVLLVAMGFPRQELWIAKHLPALTVRVAVAEGGSFSFISGAVSRAPGWMRRAGLEWAYRLLRQPWRAKRQLALPVFAWLVLRERFRRR
jgi:N-acetylglucosaminyldiphosphoundecaprenol N-acetyl-beta-D-mannosaminyltransferase